MVETHPHQSTVGYCWIYPGILSSGIHGSAWFWPLSVLIHGQVLVRTQAHKPALMTRISVLPVEDCTGMVVP